jgi:hypothetical protein
MKFRMNKIKWFLFPLISLTLDQPEKENLPPQKNAFTYLKGGPFIIGINPDTGAVIDIAIGHRRIKEKHA